ncbi:MULTISPECIES: Asp-tRNA(Asn)/Glu-tRNA(Gln) amidotransferase subunit GatC [unclassified Facklamia]|uniref:Asp-tRNA(Asn)/Glu-tRNA(Gln) amidotransferase subunit GatC n=1 Tax=Aerococcaceae TaxID=186827 RepID=UPI0013B8CC93|nr:MULTISPECIES: Asp-tRNA(Asn)/Glu-tRNA(Gln) amidotransferase subunit GatC [unclassified Facklamia]MBS4460957.1 Asp-tRNA(Asn)/Glu-tRNA(Gln) amidotransferase subunit GatC [Aerococcaceae bacterium zg-B36]NEW64738.1 Asp-tRNA(Asn)/Glu-tRNA(Gln) amidotransferase subunit GatC [Facklamia sp. 252]NEW68063.1 Asp-tRNA(Asn)/Glu-tRNA(Gln) amidotransferase subunit GatC [Facklamia sp. 253]QQD65003.1 Asp-tRNA(Asn)/Glu-tRNA(Gln) amidotransferase subunit GatC [Aerococcaceae bacterium zg-252]
MTERDEILRVANLAKLTFDEANLDAFASEFGSIIELVEHLQEVDTTGVEPTYHGNDLINIFREDKVIRGTQREDFLANAKTTQDGFIKVPAIIESEEA